MVRNSKPKIFIADDSKETASILRSCLEKFHISSRVFESAFDFLKEAHDELELAILDANIETLDGYQALIELRRMYPELLIIVISGNNIDCNRFEALERGADYFLPKPIDLNVLEKIIMENFDIKGYKGDYYA